MARSGLEGPWAHQRGRPKPIFSVRFFPSEAGHSSHLQDQLGQQAEIGIVVVMMMMIMRVMGDNCSSKPRGSSGAAFHLDLAP